MQPWVGGVIKNCKPRESDISPICPDAPNGAIVLNFGVRDDIADAIIHVKLYRPINQLRGFGAVSPPNLSISIRLASGFYNTASTTVPHCDEKCTTTSLIGIKCSSRNGECSRFQWQCGSSKLFNRWDLSWINLKTADVNGHRSLFGTIYCRLTRVAVNRHYS